MAANCSRRAAGVLFSDEELKDISGVRRGPDFVEVMCGCTSRKYGDATGKLRVFANGHLEITCECTPGCEEDKLTPAAFEKHSGRDMPRRWKYNIWVMAKGKKVPLLKTVLLRYHDKTQRDPKGRLHRDEFIRCTRCNKMRRFKQRNLEECRLFHDSQTMVNWICADLPYDNVTCDTEEERASRRALRGCTRAALCTGCTTCVCFGCEMCRFSDCSCQTCVDFIQNADI